MTSNFFSKSNRHLQNICIWFWVFSDFDIKFHMVLQSPFAEWCNHYSRLNCDFSFNDVLIFCKQYWGKKLKRYSKRPLKSGTYIKAGLSTWNILNSILLTTLLLFPDYLFWKYSSNHLNRADDLFLIQTMVLCCIVCSGGKKMLTERDLYSDIPPWGRLKQIKDSLFCLRQSRDVTLNKIHVLIPQKNYFKILIP